MGQVSGGKFHAEEEKNDPEFAEKLPAMLCAR